jgi:hypothetical protein
MTIHGTNNGNSIPGKLDDISHPSCPTIQNRATTVMMQQQ